jgi:hypothetical protein
MAKNDQQQEEAQAQVQADDNATAPSPVQAVRFAPDELNGGLELSDATEAQRNAALRYLFEGGDRPTFQFAYNVHWAGQVRVVKG